MSRSSSPRRPLHGNDRLRRRRRAALALALATGVLLALPAAAPAQAGSSISIHAIFSGGKASGFNVGTVVQIRYSDPSGQTREKQVCWSPAPIDQPACTATGAGAPAQAGTQRVTVQLTNGQLTSTTFAVAPAPTTLGNGTSSSPPVPYTITCTTELYGNLGQQTPLHLLSPGEQVAAYYRANSTTLQVYDYSSNQAGFVASSCATGPKPRARTLERTVRLRPNRTQTYRLSLPQGFEPQGPGTPIGYQLYTGNRRGDGVANPIRRQGGGIHLPFLGATVIRDGITANAVFVRVRTVRLQDPITLLISAYGTT